MPVIKRPFESILSPVQFSSVWSSQRFTTCRLLQVITSICFIYFKSGGIHQVVDPRFVGKINDLASKGVTRVQEMRRHLQEFVRNELFLGRDVPPSTSRCYFQTKKDIHNHMYCALVKNRFSSCDQTNVANRIKVWQEQYPKDKFFFRPYKDKDNANSNESCAE